MSYLYLQLIKMTFKKKDPELVTLYFVSPDHPQGKARQYRVSKRQEFVTALQVRGVVVCSLCLVGGCVCSSLTARGVGRHARSSSSLTLLLVGFVTYRRKTWSGSGERPAWATTEEDSAAVAGTYFLQQFCCSV